MKVNSDPGSSLGKEYAKPTNFFDNKGIKRQKSSATKTIAIFLNSIGLKVIPSRSSARRPFADMLTTIADIPVEIYLGLRGLSHADLNYRRSITAANVIFLIVTSAKEFEEHYNSTFKF